MKNWFRNFDEIMALVEQFSQYDEESMKIIICMLIDTASAKCKEPAGDIADIVCLMVHEVNEELGAYTLREERHDHKN